MGYWDKVKQRVNAMVGNYENFEFTINGRQLTPTQIEDFKRLTGWALLEPGRYWLDPDTGNMGVDGDPTPRMNIFQNYLQQAAQAGESQPSLSERRMLFNSADLTGIWGAY